MKTIDMVREFQLAFGIEMPTAPRLPDIRTQLLRLHLTTEELGETEHALCKGDLVKVLDGLCDLQYINDGTILVCGLADRIPVSCGNVWCGEPGMPDDPVGLCHQFNADLSILSAGFSDRNLEVVTRGLGYLNQTIHRAFFETGLASIREQAFAEVHRSNMSKLGPDGRPITDGAGRVVKGPSYSPADLAPFVPGSGSVRTPRRNHATETA